MQISVIPHLFWPEYFLLFAFLFLNLSYLAFDFLARIEISLSCDFRHMLSSTHCCIGDFLLLPNFTTVFAGTFPWSAAAFPTQDSEADLGIISLLHSFQMLLSLRKKSGGTSHHPCQFANTWSGFLWLWRSWSLAKVWRWPCWRRGKDTFLGRLPACWLQRDQLQHCCPSQLPGTFITVSVTHFNQNILAKEVRLFLFKLWCLCTGFVGGGQGFLFPFQGIRTSFESFPVPSCNGDAVESRKKKHHLSFFFSLAWIWSIL